MRFIIESFLSTDKIVFVPNALPGELVDIEITHSNKKFSEGVVLKYLTRSSDRLEIKCSHYSSCGSCQFLNIDLDKENEYKTNKVRELVKRIGNIDEDLVHDCVSVNDYNYRNKATFHVFNKELGYYMEKSRILVPIDNCLILRKEINDTIPKLKEIVLNKENYINEIMVRCSNTNSNLISIDQSLTKRLNEYKKQGEKIESALSILLKSLNTIY